MDWATSSYFACYRGWLAALRGDAGAAETVLAGLHDLRASEDPQDKAMIAMAEAFIAVARRQPEDALRHARAIARPRRRARDKPRSLRWAWPLAARAAHDLGDAAATGELLALLDSYPPGHLAPMLRAERDLSGARLADRDGDQAAAASFAAAIASLRSEHPLSPRPRPARPRRASHPRRRRRGRRGSHRRSP